MDFFSIGCSFIIINFIKHKLQKNYFALFICTKYNLFQEQYLKSRIKINGKTGNFAGGKGAQHAVTLGREKQTKIVLNSEIPFSKR